jgi:DNA-binding MarR family transcriptional regulator/N-acetylglutamate synthase-like GNAT family acetyltransferase
MQTQPARPIPRRMSPSAIEAVRGFNRFYTRQIGVLDEGLLKSPFSLTEVRVMYELKHQQKSTATELARKLSLDPGYLSRILQSFRRRGLIEKCASRDDGRQALLSLTGKGRKTFAPLDARANEDVATMLARLSPARQQRLLTAMRSIEEILCPEESHAEPYLFRSHRPGDMGWIAHRHGVLYSQEYGWDERFEALVAEIAAKFVQHYDPRRERCWVAERAGEILGCVFLVRHTKTTAKLRLLLVEPSARGLGIGQRLVEECIRFARQAGYRKILLWTNSVLLAARHIYEKAGFRIVRRERHHSFGHHLTGETWELKL